MRFRCGPSELAETTTTNEAVCDVYQPGNALSGTNSHKFNHEFSRILRISRMINRLRPAGDVAYLVAIRVIRYIRENSWFLFS